MSGMAGVVDHVGDPKELRSVVAELLKIVHVSGLERTVSIGRLVLERFFGGSAQLWRDRRRNKNNSVRRLADCAECPISRSALNQAIGVFAVLQAIPAVGTLQHLGASHISLVLPLAPSDQELWLKRANAEHWSVRRLSDEIRRERRQQGERRGRPKLPRSRRALARVRSSIRNVALAVDALQSTGVEREDYSELSELQALLSELETKLHGLSHLARSEVVAKANVPPADLAELKAG